MAMAMVRDGDGNCDGDGDGDGDGDSDGDEIAMRFYQHLSSVHPHRVEAPFYDGYSS